MIHKQKANADISEIRSYEHFEVSVYIDPLSFTGEEMLCSVLGHLHTVIEGKCLANIKFSGFYHSEPIRVKMIFKPSQSIPRGAVVGEGMQWIFSLGRELDSITLIGFFTPDGLNMPSFRHLKKLIKQILRVDDPVEPSRLASTN